MGRWPIDAAVAATDACASSIKEDTSMRRRIPTFVFAFVMAASGVATAGVFAGSRSPAAGPHHHDTEANEQDSGVHGGSIDRFHKAGSCDLMAVSSLPGNWTHGDYVAAVAADGTPAEVREAAWSDCGKPMVATDHGGGPPEHALEHMAAGQAHAGGKAEDEGSGAD
jgi:hypothetical protein